MDAAGAGAGLSAAGLLASLRRADALQSRAERAGRPAPGAPPADQPPPSKHLVAALAHALERALRARSQPEQAVDALLVWATLGWRPTKRVGQAAASAALNLAPGLGGIPLLRLAAAYALGRARHRDSWGLGPRAAAALQAALERQLPGASPARLAFLLLAWPYLRLPAQEPLQPSEALEAALLRTAPGMSPQQAAAAHRAAGRWQLSAGAVQALRRAAGQLP